MKFCISMKVLLPALGSAAVGTLLAHSRIEYRNVLTRTDADCDALGGIVTGKEEIIVEIKKGVFKKIKMTRCMIGEAEARSLRSTEAIGKIKGLSTFSKILATSGLAKRLDKENSFTLFAPSDVAFNAMRRQELDQLLSDRQAAATFVERHLILDRKIGIRLIQGANAAGGVVNHEDGVGRQISIENDRLMLGPASIVVADLEAANGVIHVIDKIQAGR